MPAHVCHLYMFQTNRRKSERFEVRQIMRCRRRQPIDDSRAAQLRLAAGIVDDLEFEVQWVGYDDSDRTWIPATNFAGGASSPMITAFMKELTELKSRPEPKVKVDEEDHLPIAALLVPQVESNQLDLEHLPLSTLKSVDAIMDSQARDQQRSKRSRKSQDKSESDRPSKITKASSSPPAVATASKIPHLYPHCILSIFEFLPIKDRGIASCASRVWNQLKSMKITSLVLYLTGLETMRNVFHTKDGHSRLQSLTKLHLSGGWRLNLTSSRLLPASLVEVFFDCISTDALPALLILNSLQRLTLTLRLENGDRRPRLGQLVSNLRNCSQLVGLVVGQCAAFHIDVEDLLTRHATLEVLRFVDVCMHSDKFDGETLAAFTAAQRLRVLSILQPCAGVTPRSLKLLRSCHSVCEVTVQLPEQLCKQARRMLQPGPNQPRLQTVKILPAKSKAGLPALQRSDSAPCIRTPRVTPDQYMELLFGRRFPQQYKQQRAFNGKDILEKRLRMHLTTDDYSDVAWGHASDDEGAEEEEEEQKSQGNDSIQ
jgi:hypothetical protein